VGRLGCTGVSRGYLPLCVFIGLVWVELSAVWDVQERDVGQANWHGSACRAG